MMKFKFLNSNAFQLVLSLSGIFFLSVLLMFAFAYFESEEELNKQMKYMLREIDEMMVNAYNSGGFEGLMKHVEAYSIGARRGETIAYLTNTEGQVLAGNVQAMQLFEGWSEVPFDDISLKTPPQKTPDAYFSFGRTFPEGYLIIGRNNYQVEEIHKVIFDAVLQVFFISSLVTLVAGFLLMRKSDEKIGLIQNTLNYIAEGDLNKRIPINPGKRDDLTRVSADINSALERLSLTVESLRQISADIAHELKTPLQRLRQDLEVVADLPDTSSNTKQAMDRIINETDSIIEIFQALLRISQIEGGSRRSSFKETNLAEIVLKIHDIYLPVAEDRQQELSLTVQEGCDFIVHGDVDLLTQMVVNLVENSLNHCPVNSVIEIELGCSSSSVFLQVKDNGPGIPLAERELVMERLYRVEKSRTTAGNGLGLSLVKAVAELHNFAVELADNNPGLVVRISTS